MTMWDVDVHRRFEHARRSFDLRVRFSSESRRLVLFGPSGAGKSQTLRIIAGLTTPDAGHVRLSGQTLVDRAAGIDVPARQRGLAFVFQDYALFPHLNVVQNIAFALQPGWRNARKDLQHEAVERWLKAFHLSPVALQYPEQLSGGQRQRTALARALVVEPRALLLDEPFAALDGALRARLRDELAELQAELDVPLLIITHDEADVQRFGDDVVCIENGRCDSSDRFHVCFAPPGEGPGPTVRSDHAEPTKEARSDRVEWLGLDDRRRQKPGRPRSDRPSAGHR